MALLLATVGFVVLRNPMLLFVGFFIFVGAASARRSSEFKRRLRGLKVSDAMQTRLLLLRSTDTLRAAARSSLAASQRDWPVFEDDVFIGVLDRQHMARAIESYGADVPVAELLINQPMMFEMDTPLGDALEKLQSGEQSVAAVMSNGILVGLITPESVEHALLLAKLRNEQRDSPQEHHLVGSH